MSTITRPSLNKVAGWQLVFISLLSIVLLPFGWGTSVSVWVGAMIHIIPHAWFAKIAFKKVGARQANGVVTDFYLGQAVKFLLTAVLMLLALRAATSIDIKIVMISFVAMFPIYLILVAKVLRQQWA
ncbi:MAG: hypothetical protein CMK43_03295 [Porticoccaceae bacterium]|nr:hypothetical protein [Porticoccaceae bacterium]